MLYLYYIFEYCCCVLSATITSITNTPPPLPPTTTTPPMPLHDNKHKYHLEGTSFNCGDETMQPFRCVIWLSGNTQNTTFEPNGDDKKLLIPAGGRRRWCVSPRIFGPLEFGPTTIRTNGVDSIGTTLKATTSDIF